MENNKRFNVLAITFMILSLLVDGVLGYQLFCEHKKTEAIDFIGHNAQELYEWGAIYEVMPLEKLNDRAWEIARQIMKTPRYGRRMTRTLLNQHWKRLFVDELETGLAHEGFCAICDAPFWGEEQVKRGVGAKEEGFGALEFENK